MNADRARSIASAYSGWRIQGRRPVRRWPMVLIFIAAGYALRYFTGG